MSDHIRLKHNAGQAEFVKPAPAPQQPEATPTPEPLLGPVARNYEPSTSKRPFVQSGFSEVGKSIEAELEADKDLREFTVNQTMNTPKRTAIRLNEAVKNGEISREDAQKFWALRYPGLDPLDAK